MFVLKFSDGVSERPKQIKKRLRWKTRGDATVEDFGFSYFDLELGWLEG